MSESRILKSWRSNVEPWSKAVRERQIESRRVVTDEAVVSLLFSLPGNRLLDIGCGEGWLARALGARGFRVTGIDAVAGLVEKARQRGGGEFHVMAYEEISESSITEKFDIAVCNFSLLGKTSVEHVFKQVPKVLNNSGCLVIQTLHPHASCGDAPYVDGWREGSWSGFSDAFVDPAPWYFRTLASWIALFHECGMTLTAIQEPVNPQTGKVASLLMVGCVSL